MRLGGCSSHRGSSWRAGRSMLEWCSKNAESDDKRHGQKVRIEEQKARREEKRAFDGVLSFTMAFGHIPMGVLTN